MFVDADDWVDRTSSRPPALSRPRPRRRPDRLGLRHRLPHPPCRPDPPPERLRPRVPPPLRLQRRRPPPPRPPRPAPPRPVQRPPLPPPVGRGSRTPRSRPGPPARLRLLPDQHLREPLGAARPARRLAQTLTAAVNREGAEPDDALAARFGLSLERVREASERFFPGAASAARRDAAQRTTEASYISPGGPSTYCCKGNMPGHALSFSATVSRSTNYCAATGSALIVQWPRTRARSAGLLGRRSAYLRIVVVRSLVAPIAVASSAFAQPYTVAPLIPAPRLPTHEWREILSTAHGRPRVSPYLG
jgi:hypothetical protein